MGTRNILVLEDHCDGWLSLFNSLLKKARGRWTVLTNFLCQAAQTIQREIRQDVSLRGQTGLKWHFSTIYDLADCIENLQTECPTAIRCAVICLSQIGHILGYEEDQKSGLSDRSSLVISSSGIGSIVAAILVSSSNLNDIAHLGQHAITVAFRMGSLAQYKLTSIAGEINTNTAQHSPWGSLSLDVEVVEVEASLENFNRENSLPRHRMCYIASSSASETMVCGPRFNLEEFQKTHNLSGSIAACYIPFGASHLYSQIDVENLCSVTDELKESKIADEKAFIVSPVTGELLQATTHAELVKVQVENILLRRRDNVKILGAIGKYLEGDECSLFVLAEDAVSQSIMTDIQSLGGERSVKVFSLNLPVAKSYQSFAKVPIAVVGMAGRFPEAADAERLWELLQKGRDVHRTVPSDRFNYATHSEPTGKKRNTSKTPYGCFINEPGLFDSRFFNMSPKEAAQTDPAQRLMILTAYEALEMAGFVPNRTPSSGSDRVATFYGQASDDWREMNSSQDIDTYFIPGGIRAFGPGRINYHLKFSGPSYSVDTACSSSFAAIHMACNSLWAGDCDTAITGGANVLTNPDIFAGLSRGHFLSSRGPCKTFDADADGYCRADGVGSVVLKRLEDAENDNDNVLGVILGVSTNHSSEAVSITHPHAPTQATLYQSILNNSGVDAHDIDYVEMHGTGTAAGDYNEMLSVSNVFAPPSRPRRPNPLYVSSIKPNIGHAEAAAGVSSLIKVLLMLRNNAIPPHVGVKGAINPAFPSDLEARNVHIPFTGQSWFPKEEVPRLAFLNNFSAAGGNTALLLQEHRPRPAERRTYPRLTHIISVSARTIPSMQMNLEQLATFLRDNPSTSVSDLSYTVTARRVAHPYRKTFTVRQLDEAISILQGSVNQSFTPVPAKAPKLIFAYTGQGSLYESCARKLFETCASFRRDVIEFNTTATKQGFSSFLGLLEGTSGDARSLPPTVAHVGQVCIQLALARLWISWGIIPSAVIGHSLGEYPALVTAGVLSTSDMIYLVGRRAQLLEQNCIPQSHAMLAVNADAESLLPHIPMSSVEISCENSPESTVLGGVKEAIDGCAQTLQASRIRCTKLPVMNAYHTAQVDSILTAFRRSAEGVKYDRPRVRVLSPLLGSTIEAGSNIFDAEYLCRHTREKVNFRMALASVQNNRQWAEDAVWLEIGPHPTCIKFIQQTFGSTVCVLKSLHQGHDPWKTMAESVCDLHLKGYDIDWEQYHGGLEGGNKLIDLPAYAWDLKHFWLQYKNDWALTKGSVDRSLQLLPASTKSRLSTTTVQRILKEKIKPGEASLLAETDFADPHLAHIAGGHRVSGVLLCPSSIYADMALTIAKYLYREMYPNQAIPDLDVCRMKVGKAFVLDQKNDVYFRISATANNRNAQLQLYTVCKGDQSQCTEHASCEVVFDNSKNWVSKWNRKSYLITERFNALDAASVTGKAHRIQRGLVYKLFCNFVDYDEQYQGIEELILDSNQLEACATVVLKHTEKGSVYEVPPTWIDGLCHLAGVILNANDAVDSDRFCFISHGWKSLRLLGSLTLGTPYRTYAKMQETEDGIMEGDVWILEGSKVIGIAKGMRFQRIPRKAIDILLPKRSLQLATAEATAYSSLPNQKVTHDAQPQGQQPMKGFPDPALQSLNMGMILDVISSECGVSLPDLVDGCTFASLGIDSLLSLEILASLRESLGIDLRSHVFLEHETIGDFKAYLLSACPDHERGLMMDFDTPVTLSKTRTTLPASATPDISRQAEETERWRNGPREGSSSPPAGVSSGMTIPASDYFNSRSVSYLLSGNPRTADRYLFLFPDGSGSATSYANLPSVGPDIAVFALNCPFMTTPSLWQSGIGTVMKLYLKEIFRRQSSGPYNFGGWSAGGVLAYEAAYQVTRAGMKVDRLILIDSPCPVQLPPMPIKMFTFLDSIGLLGSKNAAATPEWLVPHFEATVRNLESYTPVPLSPGKEPTTTAIWARRGVTSVTGGRRPSKAPGDPVVMEWLLEDRTDFKYNGWDALIEPQMIRCEAMDGHHFSMTTDYANELGRLIAEAMMR